MMALNAATAKPQSPFTLRPGQGIPRTLGWSLLVILGLGTGACSGSQTQQQQRTRHAENPDAGTESAAREDAGLAASATDTAPDADQARSSMHDELASVCPGPGSCAFTLFRTQRAAARYVASLHALDAEKAIVAMTEERGGGLVVESLSARGSSTLYSATPAPNTSLSVVLDREGKALLVTMDRGTQQLSLGALPNQFQERAVQVLAQGGEAPWLVSSLRAAPESRAHLLVSNRTSSDLAPFTLWTQGGDGTWARGVETLPGLFPTGSLVLRGTNQVPWVLYETREGRSQQLVGWLQDPTSTTRTRVFASGGAFSYGDRVEGMLPPGASAGQLPTVAFSITQGLGLSVPDGRGAYREQHFPNTGEAPPPSCGPVDDAHCTDQQCDRSYAQYPSGLHLAADSRGRLWAVALRVQHQVHVEETRRMHPWDPAGPRSRRPANLCESVPNITSDQLSAELVFWNTATPTEAPRTLGLGTVPIRLGAFSAAEGSLHFYGIPPHPNGEEATEVYATIELSRL